MPRTDRQRVLEKIHRYWPDADPQEILAILDRYGRERGDKGRDRVHLAILKLAEGRREMLAELAVAARRDYRDVVAAAEYPEQSKRGFVGMSELSRREARAVRRRDRSQYGKWLGG